MKNFQVKHLLLIVCCFWGLYAKADLSLLTQIQKKPIETQSITKKPPIYKEQAIIDDAVIWDPPRRALLSRNLNSIEKKYTNQRCLNLLLEGFINHHPHLREFTEKKRSTLINQLSSILVNSNNFDLLENISVNKALINHQLQAELQISLRTIQQDYSSYIEIFKPNISADQALYQNYLEKRESLMQCCGVDKLNAIDNIWHRENDAEKILAS